MSFPRDVGDDEGKSDQHTCRVSQSGQVVDRQRIARRPKASNHEHGGESKHTEYTRTNPQQDSSVIRITGHLFPVRDDTTAP